MDGVENYDPSKWEMIVDNEKFEIPPQICSKHGERWIIGCADDGSLLNPAEKQKDNLSFLAENLKTFFLNEIEKEKDV
jgi:hypothetical protein